MPIIEVKNLKKSFKVKLKDKGLKFKMFFVGTGTDDTWKEQVDNIGQMMRTYAHRIYEECADIKYDKSSKNIVFSLKKEATTEQDVDMIIEMLNTMYQAFLVCASTKK